LAPQRTKTAALRVGTSVHIKKGGKKKRKGAKKKKGRKKIRGIKYIVGMVFSGLAKWGRCCVHLANRPSRNTMGWNTREWKLGEQEGGKGKEY